MFEICLKRGWAAPAKAALDLCKMVEKRMYVLPFFVARGTQVDVFAEGGVQ